MHHGFWEFSRGMNSAFGTFFWGSIIIKILFWIAIIFLAYKFFKNYNTQDNSSSKALEELKLKYVNEEITEEEYKRKKNIIKD